MEYTEVTVTHTNFLVAKILRSAHIGWYSLRCPAEATSGRQIEMSVSAAGAHQSVSRVPPNLMRLVHVICPICATCSTSLRRCVPSDFVATLRMFTITHMSIVQLVSLGLFLLIANDLLRYRYRISTNSKFAYITPRYWSCRIQVSRRYLPR